MAKSSAAPPAKPARLPRARLPRAQAKDAPPRVLEAIPPKLKTPARAFPIAGIGGSAGAFEAMQSFLRNLPPDTGIAFIFVQHLDRNFKSLAAQLFGRLTKMPVKDIVDGTRVEPNHLYLLPPGKHLAIENRILRVSKSLDEHVESPIDRFFESLAKNEGSRAIGVILSGTGSDGVRGLGCIKSEGGITFAQAEKSAKHFGMPGGAMASGCVDAALPPQAIAQQIAEIARHPYLLEAPPEEEAESDGKAAGAREGLGPIFEILRHRTGVDFSLYKRSTMHRRIARRMVLHRMDDPADYVKLLRRDEEEAGALFNDLLINVTAFFRDKAVFQTLQRKILPKIVRSKGTAEGEIRIWVPGCATGEEVYSLAICMVECMRKLGSKARLQIFGTDLSESVIARARTGLYPAAALQGVPAARLRACFNRVNDQYQVNRGIRDLCTFAKQNVPQDPPFSRLDLISCRNVLIYLGPELQRRCLPIFHYSLNPGGFLLLGTAETVGSSADLFTLLDKRCKLYQKKITPVRPGLDFGAPAPVKLAAPKVLTRSARASRLQDEIQREADQIIAFRLAAGGVIINSDLQVVQFRGPTSLYLEHAAGEANLNLLQMVRAPLAMDLRGGIHKALKQDAPVRCENIPLPHQGEMLQVTMDIVPFRLAAETECRWLLVLFQSSALPPSDSMPAKKTKGDRTVLAREAERLRQELRATKESLQAIIEEQEATNEELKSANEEVESSNEELQSSNEELESAKEELQSTNEELHTLNEELADRNSEMGQINDDLQNLIASINLPIVMVDNGLLIRRATAQAEKLFNLIPTDIGRRLGDIRPNLFIHDIDERIRTVIETLATFEKEVRDKEGRTYSLRIRPYRTRDFRIDGAVITLVDIDAVKASLAKPSVSREDLKRIADILPEAAAVLDFEGRILSANELFRKRFGVPAGDAGASRIYDLDGGAWDTPACHHFLESGLAKKGKARETIELEARPGALRWLRLDACLLNAGGDALTLLCAGPELDKAGRPG